MGLSANDVLISLRMLQTGTEGGCFEVLANSATGRKIKIAYKLIPKLESANIAIPVPIDAMRWIDFDCPYWLVRKEQLQTFAKEDSFVDQGEPGPGI